MNEKFVWMLPTHQSDKNNHDYIMPNAKLHCYLNNVSLCNKYEQSYFFEHYDIDKFLEEYGEDYVCKKCLREYKKFIENQNKPKAMRKR